VPGQPYRLQASRPIDDDAPEIARWLRRVRQRGASRVLGYGTVILLAIVGAALAVYTLLGLGVKVVCLVIDCASPS
jgi:hypothetical protein